MSTILIREPKDEDLPFVLSVLRELSCADARRGGGPPDLSQEVLLQIVGGCRTFIAEIGGAAVGMNAVYLPRDGSGPGDRHAYVQAIAVAAEYRRRGVGSALMEHMFDWLAREGALTVRLSVAAGNSGARRFYLRFGFQAASVQMVRKLAPEEDRRDC